MRQISGREVTTVDLAADASLDSVKALKKHLQSFLEVFWPWSFVACVCGLNQVRNIENHLMIHFLEALCLGCCRGSHVVCSLEVEVEERKHIKKPFMYFLGVLDFACLELQSFLNVFWHCF